MGIAGGAGCDGDGAGVIRVELPWPHKNLSPNSRVHWAVLAQHKSRARADACYLCRDSMAGMGLHHVSTKPKVSFKFRPADKRRRDVDNLISSTKAHRDGIADALGIDDSNFILTAEIGEPRKPACVEVTIS